MYIVVEHEITDPKSFWETAQTGLANLPPNLKLHQALPNKDGSQAVCLWEAAQEDDVREFVEREVGNFSSNTYFAVEAQNAVGLPGVLEAEGEV